jgi:hypothetical protein
MLLEIYQTTSDYPFLKTKTALGKETIISTPNCPEDNFIQDAEDTLIDLIVAILENRIKN